MTDSNPSARDPLLRLRHVGKTYGSGTVALADIDLDVAAGEFVTLLGPSGCGKSTVLRLVAGLATPSSGTIEWSGARRRVGIEPDRIRLPGTDADAVGERRRQCRASAAARRRRARGDRDARRGSARPRRPRRVLRRLSARALRRDEDARVDRARARHAAASAAAGRALCGAGRDHALPAQQRSAAALAQRRLDRPLRHAQRLRGGLPLEPHRRDGDASGQDRERARGAAPCGAQRGDAGLGGVSRRHAARCRRRSARAMETEFA